jgi:sulfite reductase beta subunit-like hemoprotein
MNDRSAERERIRRDVVEHLYDRMAGMAQLDEIDEVGDKLLTLYDDPADPERQRRVLQRNRMKYHVQNLGLTEFRDLTIGPLADVENVGQQIEKLT